jgi:hypothetical protein
MDTELPQSGSEEGLLERLGNALIPQEALADEQATEASQPAEEEELPEVSDEETEAPAEPEEELVEITAANGKTYRVPPELKNEFMHQSDYTRSKQELKALQVTAQTALEQQAVVARFQEQTKEDSQALAQVQAELDRMKKIDWTSLDTDTYIKTRGYVDQLKDQAADLEKGIGAKRVQAEREMLNNRKQATQHAYDYISRHVKDWTPDSATEREVAGYAEKFGIPPETLGSIATMFPGFAVLAHKAAQFDRLQAGKGQAVKQAQQAPPVLKPGAVKSEGTAQTQAYQKARQSLKKDGSLEAAARVFYQRGNK